MKDIWDTPILETERLRLRPFTEADLPAFFAIFSDREVNRFLPWFPVDTLEEAEAFFQTWSAAAYRERSAWKLAVCLKRDDLPIGYVTLSGDDSHDLGYGLRRGFWGRGIATEAGRAVVERARAVALPYLTATHDRDNPRSGRVMARLGMTYRYSYQEQWQPKDLPVIFRLYQLDLDGQRDRVYGRYWERSTVHFVEKELET